jgi:hypothetical protein
VSTPNIRPNPCISQRRSQRILLSVPIIISGTRSNHAPFSERTSTLIVKAHGALIQLRERVLVGEKVRMKHFGDQRGADLHGDGCQPRKHSDSRSRRFSGALPSFLACFVSAS